MPESLPIKALRHVRIIHPTVTQVFYGRNGQWHYTDDDFSSVKFTGDELIGLLEDAADAAYDEKGFPSAYSLED